MMLLLANLRCFLDSPKNSSVVEKSNFKCVSVYAYWKRARDVKTDISIT
jgi:hypothetical protein